MVTGAAMTMNVMHPNIMVIALRLTTPPGHQEVPQTMCNLLMGYGSKTRLTASYAVPL